MSYHLMIFRCCISDTLFTCSIAHALTVLVHNSNYVTKHQTCKSDVINKPSYTEDFFFDMGFLKKEHFIYKTQATTIEK